MRRYLDGIYDDKLVTNIITQFDTRGFLFRNMIDFQRFRFNLKTIKPQR